MSIYDETLEALSRDPRIFALLREVSPGDLSILDAILDTQDACATTSDGSPNSRLWGCLAEHGWMERVEDEKFPPKDFPFVVLQYRLTDRGWRAIPIVRVQHNQQRTPDAS